MLDSILLPRGTHFKESCCLSFWCGLSAGNCSICNPDAAPSALENRNEREGERSWM